jgi:hypothetical protein
MKITVEARDVYGTTKYYPMCDRAKFFANIAGTKTLTPHSLEKIKALGYEIEVDLASYILRTNKEGVL